ncbi:MAG: sigma-70 family RNA polymerase sigma factor [Omnitrophica bacterium]|nr:sigma-70 family RNA polymerase sigma factor [Candidatus Omnitrophota bacterium]
MLGFGLNKKRQREFKDNLEGVINTLYSVALYMARNREDSEDLVQETALRAHKYYHRFNPGTNFKAWILTILRNIFINNYRKNKREPQKVDFQEVANFVSLTKITGAEEEILQEKINYALSRLPETLRTVINLFYFENFSYKEIAGILDIPVGTVMSRLYSARQMLKGSLFVYNKQKGS